MAHFAEVKDGIVTNVLVVPDEEEGRGQEFLAAALGLGGTWVQPSYNTLAGAHTNGGTPLRGNYAGIGYTYDSVNDLFYAPQPFPSWTLDLDTGQWKAPTPYPGDDDPPYYTWDEGSASWIEVAK